MSDVSPSPSPPPPAQRRWPARLRTLLHLRPRRRASSASPGPRRRHRHRRTTPTASEHALDTSRGGSHAAALRYRRTDLDLAPLQPAPQDDPDSSPDVAAPPRRAPVSSTLAELDAIEERDLFAVFHRLFDEYSASSQPPRGVQGVAGSSLYLGRLPPHARHRVAMRVHDAYYIAGSRRPARLTTELERDFRWSVRTLTFADTSHGNYDYAASDDQIEALPTFTMEKGETRSVQQIFASMGGSEAAEDGVEGVSGSDRLGGSAGYSECAICLSEFEPGDEITLLPCGHFFHLSGCVREWLRNHARTCPTCRADICSPTGSSDGLASHSATVGTTEEVS